MGKWINRAEANRELGAGRYYRKELSRRCADLPAQHIPGNILGGAAVPHPEQIAERSDMQFSPTTFLVKCSNPSAGVTSAMARRRYFRGPPFMSYGQHQEKGSKTRRSHGIVHRER